MATELRERVIIDDERPHIELVFEAHGGDESYDERAFYGQLVNHLIDWAMERYPAFVEYATEFGDEFDPEAEAEHVWDMLKEGDFA